MQEYQKFQEISHWLTFSVEKKRFPSFQDPPLTQAWDILCQ